MKLFYFSLLLASISLLIGCGSSNSQHIEDESMTLKISSYNVRNAKGMDDVVDFDRVAKVINDINADALAIQELDSATVRSNGLIVLDELAKRTNMYESFNAAIDFDGGKYGIGILTREKPLRQKALSLPGREEERCALIVEMDSYVLCCTHLSLNKEDRLASIKLIQQLSNKYESKPVFLAGDLNASPDSDEIMSVSKDWTLLSDSTQATFPSKGPTEVIDYIFLKNNDQFSHSVTSTEVVNEPMASDHRPLWVEVKIEKRN